MSTDKMNSQLYLPNDIIEIIRQYSRPIGLRLDWRTCKRDESKRIKNSNIALIQWYKYLFNLDNDLRWISQHAMMDHIINWSFYGRRHLIWASKHNYWTDGVIAQQPSDNDPNWYKQMFVYVSSINTF